MPLRFLLFLAVAAGRHAFAAPGGFGQTRRRRRAAKACHPGFLLFLAVVGPPPGADFPEQTRGDVTARLTVHVEGAGSQPGAALVRLTLTVTGGPGLEVKPPPLTDPLNAWEVERDEEWRTDGDRRTWTAKILLRQTKPGPADLPDVKVQFRDAAVADWQTGEWTAPLRIGEEAPPPEFLPPPPPLIAGWLPWVVGLVAAAVLAAAGCWIRLRRRRPGKPPPPDQWALKELDRLDGSAADPTAYHTTLSDVVRRYLADRFGLPAPRQTTAEFLETVRRSGRLPAEQQALLRDFLERCDRAKFAPVGASAEECREAAGLARALVEQTSAAKPAAPPR